MDHGIFEQIAAVLAVCVAAGALATWLHQPVLVGLIAAGIVVGPEALGLVESSPEIEFLARIGISLLLFVVGLKLDIRLLGRLGPVVVAAGLGQVLFTAALGYLLSVAIGLTPVAALYTSIALTFSSTIIVVKLLTDRRELNHLHGRVALGILIVQDLVVVLVMLTITAADSIVDEAFSRQALLAVGRGLALLLLAGLVGRYLAPRLSALLEAQAELLVLVSVTWAVLLAAVALQLGFSAEVGAFLAGMSLASTAYRDAVSSRLAGLRDFLLVFFFIDLGTKLDLSVGSGQLTAAIVLSLFVLIGNPLIVMAIMGRLGYRRKVSFKTGLTVAQISEFSLILVALGVSLGHLGSETLGLVTAIGLITITASTYMIMGSDRLFARFSGPLRVFERGRTSTAPEDDRGVGPEYVVIGTGRLGSVVVQDLLDRGEAVLGVDFDPRGTQRDHGLPMVYGDADDPDLPTQLPLGQARWVISTLRDLHTNLDLVAALRAHGYHGAIAVAADDVAACRQLQAAGADVTMRPLHLAAGPLVHAIQAHETTDGAPPC